MSPRDVPPDWDAYLRRLGIALQRERARNGLTQEAVAHAAGITRSHYQQLEKGLSRPGRVANPTLMTLVALSDVLDVPLEQLLQGG